MTKYVLCRSDARDGGWSLHAPGSTDKQIADGDAPPLLTGTAAMDSETNEWTRPDDLDYAAAAVKSATTLYDLHQALIDFETFLDDLDQDPNDGDYIGTQDELKRRGTDICELPTFGGQAPSSTDEVWAWDADSLLVGTGPFREWRIVDRQDWEEAA